MRELDINSWKRKEHFEFFSKFDDPFFGVVLEVDCTLALKFVKENNYSFFAFYLHKALMAANQTEEFRYRIENGKVLIYDKVNASPTIGREDDTFGFSFIPYNSKFEVFSKNLKAEISKVQSISGLNFTDDGYRNDVIHFSTFPWSNFTGLTQARNFNCDASVPNIVFGKVFDRLDRKIMSVSIDLHHGLADGLHAAKFIELFQKLLNT